MIPVVKSLETISTEHAVFEKNQILTEAQLNGVVDYADDQARLTRVKLLGTGLISGLRVSLVGDVVRLSPGVGVTTDGDLLSVDFERRYTSFRRFDAARPDYPLFHLGNNPRADLLPLFELLPEGVVDTLAAPLSSLPAAGLSLDQAVAVLYMESYHRDEDMCTSTGCDNRGMDAVHRQCLLLVDQRHIDQLSPKVDTLHGAFASMRPVTIDRPRLGASITGTSALSGAFSSVMRSALPALRAALSDMYTALAPFVADLFPSNPVSGWVDRLNGLNNSFVGGQAGYEYYYDLLKDLADTMNAVRDAVLDDDTWLAVDVARFPKHLLLGALKPGQDPEANRSRFYPSPATSRTAGAARRVRFLLTKLDAMLAGFRVSASASAAIRITPSAFEDQPLEERAIPCYYNVDGSSSGSAHLVWSERLSRRGEQARNLSYHADAYSDDAAIVSPLTVQIGRYPFYRIEGHLGWNVEAARKEIEAQIASYNLAIDVEAIHVGTDRRRVLPPKRRYTDLHRFHNLFRQDIAHQLDDVDRFNATFKSTVDTAISSGRVSAAVEDTDNVLVAEVASEKFTGIKGKISPAKTSMKKSFSAFSADTGWRDTINETMRLAGEFKQGLSPIVKTEFQTPFDTLIASPHLRWVDWIDRIIKHKNDKDDDRLLFGRFITDHPGAEHIGGALRGGTFILVYNSENVVVADLALPYRCCKDIDDDETEPELEKPVLRPDWILDHGIAVLPSRKQVIGKIADTKVATLRAEVQPKLEFQTSYLDLFKQSASIMATAYSGVAATKTITGVTEGTLTNTTIPAAELNVAEARTPVMVNTPTAPMEEVVNPAPDTRIIDEAPAPVEVINPGSVLVSPSPEAATYKELDLYADEVAYLEKKKALLEEQYTAAEGNVATRNSLKAQITQVNTAIEKNAVATAESLAAIGADALKSKEGQRAVAGATAALKSMPATTQARVHTRVASITTAVDDTEVKSALGTLFK